MLAGFFSFSQEDIRVKGRSLADYGDSSLTTLQGGTVIFSGGQVVGAIGTGGSPRERDIQLARIGVAAMGLTTD